MIEFWKRKEKHIEFVLGRSIDEEKDQDFILLKQELVNEQLNKSD